MNYNQSEKHVKFRVPKEAMDEIREYVTLNDELYRSYIDFCIEAIKMRLEEIRSEMQEKEKMQNPPVLSRMQSIRKQINELTAAIKTEYLEETSEMLKKTK